MSRKPEMREAIIQLKEVKKERELSSAEIHAMVMAAGYNLSLASVKRVFAEHSEEQGFHYTDTILPIVQVLLSVKEETTAENRPTDTEVDALKSVLLLKEKMIEELTKQVAELRQERDDAKLRAALYRAELEACTESLMLVTESIRQENKQMQKMIAEWGKQ